MVVAVAGSGRCCRARHEGAGAQRLRPPAVRCIASQASTAPLVCPPHLNNQQTLVDPEAAAKRKIRKQARKASGKRKQMEHVKRLRSSGVVVKNKKQRTDGDGRRDGRRQGGRGGGRF